MKLLLIFFIISIFYICILKIKKNNKPKIWLYWENKPGSKKPEYLKLCYDSVVRNCSKDFDINLLNEKTVYNFIPDLPDLSFLKIPQKTDYIRLCLLKKYGGIWLDSDVIVINNLLPLIKKLDTYEFVGFGCHTKNCIKNTNGFPKPANWVLVSRKNGKLISNCLDKAKYVINKSKGKIKKNYHKIGRKLFWSEINNLLINDKNWKYYHYNSKCIERDSHGKKLINKRMISKENIDKNCIDKLLFVPIYNTAPGFPKWFLKMSREKLLKSNYLISKFFRLSLKIFQ